MHVHNEDQLNMNVAILTSETGILTEIISSMNARFN